MAAFSFLIQSDDPIGPEKPPLNFQQISGLHPEDLFDETFLQNHPATRVASYRQDVASELAGGTAEGDEQMLERLRALGYIN